MASCGYCGPKRKLGGATFSLLATPVQIGRNLIGLAREPAPEQPSPALEQMVRFNMARRGRSVQ